MFYISFSKFLFIFIFCSSSTMAMHKQDLFNQKMDELLVSIKSENEQMSHLIVSTYSNLYASSWYCQDKIRELKKLRDHCTNYVEKKKIIEELTNYKWSLEMLFKNKLYERLNEKKKSGEEMGEDEALELLKFTVERYKKDLCALKHYLMEKKEKVGLVANIDFCITIKNELLIDALKKILKNRNNKLHQQALEQLRKNYHGMNDLSAVNFFLKQLNEPLPLRYPSKTIDAFYTTGLPTIKLVLDESKIKKKHRRVKQNTFIQ